VFAGMASTQGPLVLTLVFVTVTMWRTAVLADPWAALRWLPVSLLVNLPLLTAVWVYLALLLGVNRLGRRALSLTAFPQDLSLGLGEVGRLAFTAFWIYWGRVCAGAGGQLRQPGWPAVAPWPVPAGGAGLLCLPGRPAPAAGGGPPPLSGVGRSAVRACL
jgi:hypothetical protein